MNSASVLVRNYISSCRFVITQTLCILSWQSQEKNMEKCYQLTIIRMASILFGELI